MKRDHDGGRPGRRALTTIPGAAPITPITPTTPLAALAALASMVLGNAACTVGPDYRRPELATPAAWAFEPARGAEASAVELAAWWTSFGDPLLEALVREALAGNLDLREARLRVVEARAARGVVAADFFPQVDATGGYSRSRGSEATDQGRFNSRDITEGSDLFELGFDASWEIDVFGRIRRGVEAAEADIEAALEDERAVRVSLAAEVARNYLELRTAQSRLLIARRNTAIQSDALDLARSRFEAGLTSELDVARAEAQLFGTRATAPVFQSQARTAAYRLGVLLGKAPGALLEELGVRESDPSASMIPTTPARIPVGLPSALLSRRSDLRRAEREVAAQSARVGVATAALFPRFSVTGSFGLQSADAGDFFEGDARFWSIGPAFRWPVLEWGRLRQNIRVQDARFEQALVRYERSLLTALEEVDAALVRFAKEQDRRDELRRAVEADLRAVDLAQTLYARGLTDFSAVIDAQRQLLIEQDRLAESDGLVVTNAIALYKALGGGWEVLEPTPADAALNATDAEPGATPPQPTQPAPTSPAAQASPFAGPSARG